MKYASIIILILLLGCGSGSNPSLDERHLLYNEIFSQLINDNYYQMCVEFDSKVEVMYSDLMAGEIDSIKYMRMMDSLKIVRKKTSPKCVVDYTKEFQIFSVGRELSDENKFSMTECLKDSFLVRYFPNESLRKIVDTLSRPAQLDAKDLTIGELDIVPYTKKANRPFGEGIGVLCFSRTYFNREADRAILFYEFNCGPKCGAGEVIFADKLKGKWRIVAYKRIWDN